MNNALNMITMEQLNEHDREIADVIGLEAFRKLVATFGGSLVYIKKAETFLLPFRDDLIRKEFNGNNSRALAQKFGISQRHVLRIVEDRNGGK